MLRPANHLFLPVSFLLLACTACGGGDGGGVETGQGLDPTRIELAWSGPAPEQAEERVVASLPVLQALEEWEVTAERKELAPIPDSTDEDARGLLLFGKKIRVKIPGPFQPARFNHLVVTLISRNRGFLSAHLRRGGDELVSAEGVLIQNQELPQRIVVPLGGTRAHSEPFDDLFLELKGAAVVVMAIELVHKPLHLWVPDPRQGPSMAAVGDEMRPALALRADGRLTGSVSAAEGSRLALSYSPVAEFWPPGARATLGVELRGPGGWSERLDLPLAVGAPGELRWAYHDQELEGFPGGELTFECEVAAHASSEPFVWVGQPTVYREQAEPSTVLFVTSDTHRGDHIGSAKLGVSVRTPTLDALAARGVLYERAQTSTNITVPSHVALMTGHHPRDTGVTTNRIGLSGQALTLAETFQENGYRTHASVSAVHLGDRISGLGQGFDRISAPELGVRRAEDTMDLLREWSKEVEGQPLFVWLHVFDAHPPYKIGDAADEYLEQIEPLPGEDMTAKVRQMRAWYRGEVTYLDEQLGRLLEEPRFAGGLIAVTGDHGECLGQHGLYFTHDELYIDTLHVPLILTWPGGPAGVRVASSVRQIDLGRTVLDLAGLTGVEFPGRNLARHIDAEPDGAPIFALSSMGRSASISAEGHHLILHLQEHMIGLPDPVLSVELHQVELFDLDEDWGCDVDLLEERPEVARRLQRRLVKWLASEANLGWTRDATLTAQDLADLAAMGYATADTSSDERLIDPECACAWCERFR